MVGQFWRAQGGLLPLEAAAFADFDDPAYAKLVFGFLLVPQSGGTLLKTETRVHGLSPASERRFWPYWLLIRPVSGMIRRQILDGIAQEAQRSPSAARERFRGGVDDPVAQDTVLDDCENERPVGIGVAGYPHAGLRPVVEVEIVDRDRLRRLVGKIVSPAEFVVERRGRSRIVRTIVEHDLLAGLLVFLGASQEDYRNA
jgi:hypothetical protein